MKKLLIVMVVVFMVVGCTSTNPPAPPSAKGKWVVLETPINVIKGNKL